MLFKRISSYPVLGPQAICPDYLFPPNPRKSSADKPVPIVSEFDAQLQILELIDHKVLLIIATSRMRRICEVTQHVLTATCVGDSQTSCRFLVKLTNV